MENIENLSRICDYVWFDDAKKEIVYFGAVNSCGFAISNNYFVCFVLTSGFDRKSSICNFCKGMFPNLNLIQNPHFVSAFHWKWSHFRVLHVRAKLVLFTLYSTALRFLRLSTRIYILARVQKKMKHDNEEYFSWSYEIFMWENLPSMIDTWVLCSCSFFLSILIFLCNWIISGMIKCRAHKCLKKSQLVSRS